MEDHFPLAPWQVQCWGSNDDGHIARDMSVFKSDTPEVVSGLTDQRHISSSYSHVCVVADDGTVNCWGDNTFGQLGQGATGGGLREPAVVADLPIETVDIDASATHSCARSVSDELYCWGSNSWGAISDDGQSFPAPVVVEW